MSAQEGTSHPFAPPQAELRHIPEHGYDLVHVALTLMIDEPRKTFRGTVVNTVAPIRSGLTAITLHCAAAIAVDSVQVDGRPAPFTREGDLLKAEAPRALASGRRVAVTIHYSRDSTQATNNFRWVTPTATQPDRRGFWTRGGSTGNRQWLPTWDHPSDLATSETRVTVPADWTVIGNGVLQSNTPSADGRSRTFHWSLSQPHPTYVISLAGGPFSVTSTSARGVPLSYVVPKGKERFVDYTFGDTPAILAFFTERLGVPYPWPKYSQAALPGYAGAQENVSATSLNDWYLTDRRMGLSRYTETNAHEMAHQWFGNLVTPNEWGQLWLSEGFATFFRYLWVEHSRGPAAYDHLLAEQAADYLGESRRYTRPIATNLYRRSSDLFDAHSYQKAGWVLHTLRRTLGDSLFFAGLRHYLSKHAHRSVDSRDLSTALTEATGVNVGPFFEQWIHRAGHPILDYEWSWDAAAKQVAVTVKQLQPVGSGAPPYDLAATIGMIGSGRMTRVKHRIHQTAQRIVIAADGKPDAVIVDPDHDFLREIPALHWSRGELLAIVEHAPNAIDRQTAVDMLVAAKPTEAEIARVLSVIRADTAAFPVFRRITRLTGLATPAIADLFRAQLAHANLDRRVQGVMALASVRPTDDDVRRVRALVTDDAPYELIVAAVGTLGAWDPVANRDVLERARVMTWPDATIRLEASSWLRRADAREGKATLDPERQMTQKLRKFVSDYAHGVRDTTIMSRALLTHLPTYPPGDHLYLEDMETIHDFAYIVRDDVDMEMQKERVKHIYSYRMTTRDPSHWRAVVYMRFFVDAQGRVIDFRDGP